ncbi:LIM and SH3 domain protein 1-like isoform X1 [Antedon mediterranea]|uniref:LIM and SH3 domain protein 1-like isoform X1 n=1 Tax=Antedon mediterranea TaxID=105859 RepID=UPI003AF98D73
MSGKPCARCTRIVYSMEQLKCLDQIWHKGCFSCEICNTKLTMKNYKGYSKKPYCNAHYPTTKFTQVADTPENRRVKANTKTISNVQYHKDLEEQKGKKISVESDPLTDKAMKNTKIQSNLVYHGHAETREIENAHRPQEKPKNQQKVHLKTLPLEQPDSSTITPTPVISDEPTPVISDEPTPVISDEPTPVISVEQTPVISDEPTPVISDEPTPVISDEPTTVISDEPTTVISDEPTTVISDEPTPVISDESTTVISDEPTPVISDEPTTVISDEPTTVISDEPTPVISDEPTPVISVESRTDTNPAEPAEYNPMRDLQEAIGNEWAHQPAVVYPQAGGHAPVQGSTRYVALYDYAAADHDEVSFSEGDFIINPEIIDDGWMTGTVESTGRTGMLPSNYVEKV